jgi:hypothetical protein
MLLCDRMEIGRGNVSTHVESPALSWVTGGDVRKLFLGRIGDSKFPPLTVADIGVLLSTKIVYFGYALALVQCDGNR